MMINKFSISYHPNENMQCAAITKKEKKHDFQILRLYNSSDLIYLNGSIFYHFSIYVLQPAEKRKNEDEDVQLRGRMNGWGI